MKKINYTKHNWVKGGYQFQKWLIFSWSSKVVTKNIPVLYVYGPVELKVGPGQKKFGS